jgi:hypothetical protein
MGAGRAAAVADDGDLFLEPSSAMAEWIEEFYNPLRRHSALG